jgi:CRAL/TRIO domain
MRSTLPHATMQAMLYFIQRCAAYRLAGIHVVHQPAFMSFLWTIVRPFLGEKMRRRIFFHGADIDSLADVMDASLLPPEMGGTCADDPMRWLDEEIEKEDAELLQGAAR